MPCPIPQRRTATPSRGNLGRSLRGPRGSRRDPADEAGSTAWLRRASNLPMRRPGARLSIWGRPERLRASTAVSPRFGGVMKYLCLIYDEEKKLGAMSKSESDGFMGEYSAYTEGIRKSGHYVAGEALEPVQT